MENNTQGTPKTLDEAIRQALMVGPLNQITERAYFVLKDFLSQRFGVAILMSNGDGHMEKTLRALFEEIVRREEKDLPNPKV